MSTICRQDSQEWKQTLMIHNISNSTIIHRCQDSQPRHVNIIERCWRHFMTSSHVPFRDVIPRLVVTSSLPLFVLRCPSVSTPPYLPRYSSYTPHAPWSSGLPSRCRHPGCPPQRTRGLTSAPCRPQWPERATPPDTVTASDTLRYTAPISLLFQNLGAVR